jgi:hypothetical protein
MKQVCLRKRKNVTFFHFCRPMKAKPTCSCAAVLAKITTTPAPHLLGQQAHPRHAFVKHQQDIKYATSIFRYPGCVRFRGSNPFYADELGFRPKS